MMKEYCNISLQHFIMAGIDKDGKLVTFTGPRETVNPMVLKQYVDVDGYYNWYNTGSMIPSKVIPVHSCGEGVLTRLS